jgi:aspartate racemase
MKVAGIIGGIAPESTIEYYRLIVAAYRERLGDGSYPALLINSIDMQKMLGLIAAEALSALTEYLLREIDKLARAGAEFGLLASNTPHVVFAELQQRAPLPLLSLVEAACVATQALGLKRVGLIGTRFTMQGNFYPAVFGRAGVKLVAPNLNEQTFIHDRYVGELIHGVFLPETAARVREIIEGFQAREGIDGLILGGTELPLLLRNGPAPAIPYLDTTKLHVERVVTEMLS